MATIYDHALRIACWQDKTLRRHKQRPSMGSSPGVRSSGVVMVESPNALELLLAKATVDPASRPAFYKALLEAEIFVVGFTDPLIEGRATIPEGAKISIEGWTKNDGTLATPFFTSLEALHRAHKVETRFVAMPARSFFELTRGSFLVLNPMSPHGKEFLPEEVTALLETGMNSKPVTRVIEKETKVLLGQPADYPGELVSSLSKILTRHPQVKAAYLCLMHDPERDEKPVLVIGLEGDGNLRDAISEAGAVATETKPIDFTVLKRGEKGISEYMFESVTPFYERTWGIKLRSLFGFR